MNYFKSNNIKIIVCVVLILIIVIAILPISRNQKKETFTSGFRQMYRPHIRNVRLISEGYYNKIKSNTDLLFRKFGLI
jgi:dolichol kinase